MHWSDLADGSRKRWLGVTMGFLSALCYGLVAFAIHATGGRFPATQITFFRSAVVLLAVSPMVYKDRKLLFSRHALTVWVRSALAIISILCSSWNLQHTSIGFTNVLFNLAPIVVLILGFVSGAIPSGLKQTGCMLLVVTGSCLFWFGAPVTPSLSVWLVGLTGAVAAGAAYTMLERQTGAWSTPTLLWPASMISLPLMLVLKAGPWSPLTVNALVTLVAMGLFCLAAQFFVVSSFRNAGLAIGTALVPSSVAFGIGIEAIVTKQIRPSSILGCVVYLSGLMPLLALRSNSIISEETVDFTPNNSEEAVMALKR